MDLSIIIPAFEEAQKIAKDVEAAAAFLEDEHLTGEIIVVDDGSRDDTAAAAEAVDLPTNVHRKVIRYEINRGKGYAVRTDMATSSGEYVMFADSGLCVPYANTLRGLKLLRGGSCELAHGSRKLPESTINRPQARYRRDLSRIFHRLMVRLLRVPPELTDTQCGFKLYQGEVARELYGMCVTDGFLFDIEVILRANQAGYCIREFPIEWTSDRDSRLALKRNAGRILIEILAIRRALAEK